MSGAPAPGPLALVGSGEYLPEMADLEGGLIAGRSPRYVQIATAAVPDGKATLERWHNLGIAQANRLGVEPVIVPVNERSDAEDPKIAALVEGAGLIYLSGGHPGFLAETLRGTAVWAAIVEAWEGGSALAGCSAGAMAFSAWVPSLRHPREGGTEGLGLLPHLRVIPHFDAFVSRIPDMMTRFLLPHDPDVTVLGVDEETAIVGGPTEWVVKGRSSAWRLSEGGREQLINGTSISTPL
jgi:cyanophycinase